MVELDITVEGAEELAQSFSRKSLQLDSKLRYMSNQIARIFQRWVKLEAPHKTGRLKSTIMMESNEQGGRVFMGSGAPYSDWVIDGRGPVVAKHAQALRFKVDGQWIFRKRAKASKPNYFVDRGYDRSMGGVDNEVRKFMDWLEE